MYEFRNIFHKMGKSLTDSQSMSFCREGLPTGEKNNQTASEAVR